ncbi:hypothetical protein [Streptomyces spiramyceticus]|uniref:hypothetical protein n=1 Tax=Streptomyces spiramyceticus TaxID=299717 RepID=UPI00237A382C|nr:hypothetical protein [Streptomyces spiramyceticus]
MTTATRISAADATVTVISTTDIVTDWAARYFGDWWNATSVTPESICTGPIVSAEVDPDRYAHMATKLAADPHEETVYAKSATLLAKDDAGSIRAVSPGENLAYLSEPDSERLTITGCDAEAVAVATARLAREAVRGVLLRSGWTLLHASAVVRDGRAVLTFGSKGSGKTTTALLLAKRKGWELLANDRIFVRPDNTGGVQVLPWPSAAALGLGLLDALGLYDVVRHRMNAGEKLHPTQDQRVTEALVDGSRTPLWSPSGKELKAQIFPDQFSAWFGLDLATRGRAAMLLFPSMFPVALPALADEERALAEEDFMSGATEDRYPDIFRLARVDGGGRAEDRTRVSGLLAELPHHSIILGHDTNAAADFLGKLTDTAWPSDPHGRSA